MWEKNFVSWRVVLHSVFTSLPAQTCPSTSNSLPQVSSTYIFENLINLILRRKVVFSVSSCVCITFFLLEFCSGISQRDKQTVIVSVSLTSCYSNSALIFLLLTREKNYCSQLFFFFLTLSSLTVHYSDFICSSFTNSWSKAWVCSFKKAHTLLSVISRVATLQLSKRNGQLKATTAAGCLFLISFPCCWFVCFRFSVTPRYRYSFILSLLRKDLLNISSSCWLDKWWNKWKEKRSLFLMKKPWKLSELLFSTAARSLLLKLLWPNKITFFFTFLNFHSTQFMLCLRFLLPLHLDFWYIPFYRSYSKCIRWRHWIVFFFIDVSGHLT